MKPNFTPGPWKIGEPCWHRGACGANCKQPITAGSGGTIAIVFKARFKKWNPDFKIGCSEPMYIGEFVDSPNAAIVAAAPDMYEALESMAEYFQAVKTPDIYDDPGTMKSLLLETARKNVAEALKKARGEK